MDRGTCDAILVGVVARPDPDRRRLWWPSLARFDLPDGWQIHREMDVATYRRHAALRVEA